MPRPKRETRNGLLYCPACERWLHPSRFSPDKSRNGTVTTFRSRCKACAQSDRTDKKNADRAAALVKQRAQVRAHAAGVPLEFFMDDLNWKSLVPLVRAYHEGWCDAQEDVRLSVASYYGMSASEPVRAPEDCTPEWTPHANGTVALFR